MEANTSSKPCYSCGMPEIGNETVEHIPAKNLYFGYKNEYKINLITVPSCLKCNQYYSKIDHILRDAIGITNNSNNNNIEITKKAVSSILRNSNWTNRTIINNENNVAGVRFEINDIDDFYIKNFRGLFYNTFNIPLPNSYHLDVINDFGKEQHTESGKLIVRYLNQEMTWKISGHQDIFRYKLAAINTKENSKELFLTKDWKQAISIICIMEFHRQFSAVVVATRQDYYDTVLTKASSL